MRLTATAPVTPAKKIRPVSLVVRILHGPPEAMSIIAFGFIMGIGRLAGSWINPAKGIPPQAANLPPLLRTPTSIHLGLPRLLRQIADHLEELRIGHGRAASLAGQAQHIPLRICQGHLQAICPGDLDALYCCHCAVPASSELNLARKHQPDLSRSAESHNHP
jgi:hypothetical protein